MGMMTPITRLAVAVLVVVMTALVPFAAACGDGDDAEPAVTGASDSEPAAGGALAGPEVTVVGFLFDDTVELRVCPNLLESFPAQCGGSPVRLDNRNGIDLGDLASESGVSWSEAPVMVSGIELENGTIVVESVRPAD